LVPFFEKVQSLRWADDADKSALQPTRVFFAHFEGDISWFSRPDSYIKKTFDRSQVIVAIIHNH
jgi:hypothetical protein